MPLFGDREKAYEDVFAHGEETRFRALARRNRALGRWAAEQLELSGDAASAYVDKISNSTIVTSADEALLEIIYADFQAAHAAGSKEQIRRKMSELMALAITQAKSTT
ncbi:MAG: hypothetical protein JWL62_1244 [Hyphomicrobiales bacterium]|nr:hypothetical protein [Hyphomicrobiales bacterium]